ncbi:MAG: winged helix-turn-helix transcriptional regulator [Rhodocyclaceae bacterium]|nr:winged helix-turn-helix transcriptional regulator [Rhodocyclaceae bacterium]
MRELDRIDRKMLVQLQKNGRISVTELAASVGLSATPVSERLKRLEREGIITGYHAHLNPEAVGLGLLVFVEIKLSTKSADVFEQVRREILFVSEVLECHLVSGDFDYLVKARIHGMAEYRRLLGNILLKLPAAAESRSYVVMEELKETTFLAVGA